MSLPHLSTVYAHAPRPDPVLGAVLQEAVHSQNRGDPSPFLRELRELYLFQEIPAYLHKPEMVDDSNGEDPQNDEIPDNGISLRLHHLWPVFCLANLRTLSLFKLVTDRAVDLSPASTRVSHIEDLSLIGYLTSSCTLPDVGAIISQPESLRSFSFYLRDDPYNGRGDFIISNAEIWTCLQQHRHTIESIDFYREGPVAVLDISASSGLAQT